mgnify:CR=1 FL=1
MILTRRIKMKRLKGKVIKVFIPDGNNREIGFRVETNEGIKEIIEEQNEYNAQILREDEVILTEQVIDNHYFIDIELEESR